MVDLIERSFTDAQENIPQVLKNSKFVVKDTMPHGTGEYKRFAERIDRTLYGSRRAEGDASAQAKVQYGYEKDMRVYTTSLEIEITKRMRDAGKNQDILDKVTMLSEVCPMTTELNLGLRFANAWNTSYTTADGYAVDCTVGDGKSLINTAHTLTGSGITYSNQITGNPVFSKAALETAETSFVNESFDNLGQSVVYNPDVILISDDPVTVNAVRTEVKSTSSTTDNKSSGVINVNMSKYEVVIAPSIRLNANGGVDTTKSKYWFLIASDKSDLYHCTLNAPYLKTPMSGNNGEDFSSENWKFLTACDEGITAVSGKWIRGSNGTGS